MFLTVTYITDIVGHMTTIERKYMDYYENLCVRVNNETNLHSMN